MKARFNILVPVVLCSFAWQSASAIQTPYQTVTVPTKEMRVAYKNAISLTDVDEAAGFTAMENVAKTGFPNALHRLAYYHQRGIGTAIDTDRAKHFYREAVAEGSARSLLSLGKILMIEGQADAAVESLSQAVVHKVNGAESVLALAHVTRRFGARSEPGRWTNRLVELAESGDRLAAIGVLRAMTKGFDFEIDEAALVDDLSRRAKEGDGRAAEVLLVYFRLNTGKQANSLAKRQQLLQHPDVRSKISTVERLYYARDVLPTRFWLESEAILSEALPADYARALFITSRINKNAYVRILQKELRSLQLYSGRATAYLNRSTIKGINAFCRKNEVWESCMTGPLRSQTIKTISQELAEHKMDPCLADPIFCAKPQPRPRLQ